MREILNDLDDSPIIYLIVRIRELLNTDTYNQLLNDKNFSIENNFHPIEYHSNAHSSDNIFHELTDDQIKDKTYVINLLEHKYKAKIDNTNTYRMKITVRFNSYKKYKVFFRDCFNNIKSNINNDKEGIEGDLMDLKKKTQYGNNTYKITLNEYEINLMIKLFKLQKATIYS